MSDVLERFTEPARQVIVLAQEEAHALGHGYVGTEHLLLGLLREGRGAAARILASLGIEHDAARERVLAVVGRGDDVSTGLILFTPRLQKILELARREATRMGHGYTGTEHLLLGLVIEGEGVANRLLAELGATAERLRAELTAVFGASPPEPDDDALFDPSPSLERDRPARLEPVVLGLGALLFAAGLLVGRRIRR